MNLIEIFITRRVATTLLTLAVVLAGLLGFASLPVSPLPQIDFPTIFVQASLPGASPETMAATVATPLERSLGVIAGISEITSTSSLGSTGVVLQFDLSRNIDGAARDVQAALNASRSLLPTGMPSNPTYRKVNPADAPIMILALTSSSMTRGQMYDAASTILAQKISQIKGIGQVTVGGASLPAVRVELNPAALSQHGIGVEQVRTAIVATNSNHPKGYIEDDRHHWQILANDQARTAAEYRPLIVAYNNGAPVRLRDVANVEDSVQDIRNLGVMNGEPAVMLILSRQPGANILATVARVRALLPMLQASIPAAITLTVAMDRTPTIRASLVEVERALMISVVLVILAVLLFLRNGRAALIPGVAVPVSLIGTFGIMYLAHFSLNTISLMALTIATGFVVDDAVVVVENVTRHIENGIAPLQAALAGTREVSFTVLAMSLSLIAVFIPILLMGGIVGRLFREFAVTLSAAILVSLAVSLTLTPMMCAWLLRPSNSVAQGRFYRWSERFFAVLLARYRVSLDWALRHSGLMLAILLATISLNVYLYKIVPKGFFPQQDTGKLIGGIKADQSISFQAMRAKLVMLVNIVDKDPAVAQVVGFTSGASNAGRMFIVLKPIAERRISADRVIARLRRKLAGQPGIKLVLQAVQDIRVGGRASNAQYQYTLQADKMSELRKWEPLVRAAVSKLPEITDIDTDQQDKGSQVSLVIDRDAMLRLGLTQRLVDTTLNDLFGQRLVSTIYEPLNQYWVVMEAAPSYWQSPESLKTTYVIAPGGLQIPLAGFARFVRTTTPLQVNHQGQFVSTTISFNLPLGVSLSTATRAIDQAMLDIHVPDSVRGSFQGTAEAFRKSLSDEPLLILAALFAVYIVLGVLYESLVHPLTILSTLPSAGVGAILALLLFHMELNIIGLIGIILLIGIVKKNAIMMIDFAIAAERQRNLSPREAIYEACLLRFRPILMTTVAASFAALPLALGSGDGAELRQPLGIAIVGGLILSQLLTLYTTPVVYLYLDGLRLRVRAWRRRHSSAISLHSEGDNGHV
ncbi:MAG: multidrug efflux RND transporter permease subunit [Burkholderiales bacterium]